MPHFFNKKELTQEQLENWTRYVDMYEKTLGFNVNRELLNMQENQKEKFECMFGNVSFEKIQEKMIESAELMGNVPGDEKSALFFRLISGKKPFLYRVPLSYSYPDYDIMEAQSARELSLDVSPMSQLIETEDGKKTLNINQCHWKVLNHTETYAEVTFGEWEKLGFIWSVELKDIKASESQKSIISHHNPKLIKITQYDELALEADFQVRNRLRAILINIDEHEAKQMKEEYQKYNGFADIMYQQEALRGKDMLLERKANGLTDYPTEKEIQEMISKEIPNYLGEDYYVVDNELYLKTWFMEKKTHKEMKEEYYLAMP